MFIKYLELVGYEIKNRKGNSCLALNICDSFLLFSYLVLVVMVLWQYGMNTMSYFVTLILSLRSLFKFWIKHKKIKSGGSSISISYIISIVVYLFLTCLLVIFYFFLTDATVTKVLLTIYYSIFALFETTDILVNCYDAEPRLYK